MKHISTFGVKTYSSLKVKRCTLFVTGYETSSSLEERAKEEEQAYSNHDTFWEDNNFNDEVEPAEAPKTSEVGQRFQLALNGKFLKGHFPCKKTCLTNLLNKSLNYSTKKKK